MVSSKHLSARTHTHTHTHSYFTTCLASADNKSKPPSQLTRDNLQTLADLFILCQSRFPPDHGSKFTTPPLTPLEEMQLLLSLHGQLEDQQSLELHYCIFDAVFGGITIPLVRQLLNRVCPRIFFAGFCLLCGCGWMARWIYEVCLQAFLFWRC